MGVASFHQRGAPYETRGPLVVYDSPVFPSVSLYLEFIRTHSQTRLSISPPWPWLASSLFRDRSTNTSQAHPLSLTLSHAYVLCWWTESLSLSLFIVAALRRLGVKGVEIRKPEQLDNVASLIIPGGESTTMAKLAQYHNLVLSRFLSIRSFFLSFPPYWWPNEKTIHRGLRRRKHNGANREDNWLTNNLRLFLILSKLLYFLTS